MGRVPAIAILLLAGNVMKAGEFPQFVAQTLDDNIGKVCYAVTIADVNADTHQDIVAVTENRVLWYENPTWSAHVMIEDQTPRDNVCLAPFDIDGDGQVDFALGAGWTKIGTIHWISRAETLDEKWKVHSIGEERWLHRMRWADVLGTGRAQLVISPLNATVGSGVRLTAFEIPDDPVRDRWPSTVLDASLNRMHNHWHRDFDRDGTVDTLTSSSEGVHVVSRSAQGWSRLKLGNGAAADDPNLSGAGEIKMGRLVDGTEFIVTVEPMHGHSVALYVPSEQAGAPWERHVIDTGFQRGHALWTADMDGDGSDEIVFGHSDTPGTHGVIIYDNVAGEATNWTKHVIDEGGIATEDLIVEDFNQDGRPDIVAGGRATHNLKLYWNSEALTK